MLRLVAATANPDKLREIEAILSAGAPGDRAPANSEPGDSAPGASAPGAGIILLARPDNVPIPEEDAPTMEGNARIKARCIADATGQPAVADDTGLEVAALGGAPGVHSARYAGPDASYRDNVAALLSALADVPPSERQARFRTVALVRAPDGTEVMAQGTLEGSIALAPRGEGGFGYDPVFVPDQFGRAEQSERADQFGRAEQLAEQSEAEPPTLAQLTDDQKNSISARGMAFRNLVRELKTAGWL